MVADFDSVRQRELWESVGAGEAEQRLTAILRLACLLEGRLIITDAQLLDGIYFLTHGPDEVAALLGCDPWRIPLSVSVEARFRSLEESLEAKTADADFEWSSQAAIAGEAEPERILALEKHARRRREWLEAVRQARLDEGRFARFGFDTFERHWDAIPATSNARVSLEQLGLVGCTARSLARNVIAERFGSLSESQGRSVYGRWDAAYQSALAETNDASWMYFSDGMTTDSNRSSENASATRLLRRAFRTSDRQTLSSGAVRLDGTLLDDFAHLDGAVYALAAHKAGSAVEKWRESPSSMAAHEVSYAVTDTLAASASRILVFRRAFVRMFALFTLAVAVLLMSLDASHADKWAPAIAILGFVVAIPWSEFMTTFQARTGRLQAVIRVEAQ